MHPYVYFNAAHLIWSLTLTKHCQFAQFHRLLCKVEQRGRGDKSGLSEMNSVSFARKLATRDAVSTMAKVPAKVAWPERRSSTRPHFIDGWRKTIVSNKELVGDQFNSANNFHVDVWIAQTESLLRAKSSFKILTAEDWAALGRLRNSVARNGALVAKLLLRLGLSRIVERRVAPHQWKFEKTELGKPVVHDAIERANFSVSHADDVVVVAVSSDLELGVDVESIDQELETNFISGFSHPTENEVLQGVPRRFRSREFMRLWTHKEAYTKLLGRGHSVDFSSFECPPNAPRIGRDDRGVAPIHFENFYVPVGHSLYHTSLAIGHSNVDSIDVRVINAIGPSGVDGEASAPVVN
jgi:phosphopantetheinyl transferase